MKELTCYYDSTKEEYVIIDAEGQVLHKNKSQFDAIRMFLDTFIGKDVFYRGQSHDFELLPSILRDDYVHLLDNYAEYLKRVAIDHHIELMDCGDNTLKQLAKMQHYGFPTNLLDVTTNPYKALGFMVDFPEKLKADDEKPSCMYIFQPRDGNSKFVTLSNSTEEPEDICTIIPNNNQIDNIRLHAQSGLFIFSPKETRKNKYSELLGSKYEITKLTVKFYDGTKSVNEIIQQLNGLHYGLNTLYPDMVKRSDYFKFHWKK